MSPWLLLVVKKSFRQMFYRKSKTHVLCSLTFFFHKSCCLYDNVKKYFRAEQGTDDNIIRHIFIACWITKATDTHSEYVIIIAFRRQQWSRERASMLRYTYIACLVVLALWISTTILTSLSEIWTWNPLDCDSLSFRPCRVTLQLIQKYETITVLISVLLVHNNVRL